MNAIFFHFHIEWHCRLQYTQSCIFTYLQVEERVVEMPRGDRTIIVENVDVPVGLESVCSYLFAVESLLFWNLLSCVRLAHVWAFVF